VVGVPHPTLGEEVVALVVGDGCDPQDLQAFVRDRVAAYKYPRLVAVVDDLPRGPSGKVLRRQIDVGYVTRVAGALPWRVAG
jgi:long-chain acyl-CoA synthetase